MMNMREIPLAHPGEILLEDWLKPMNISQYALAKAIDVPPRRINEIVKGKRAITADTALRLAAFLAIGAWAAQGVFYVFNSWSDKAFVAWLPPGFAYHTAFVLFAGWVGWRSRWRDLVVLALAVLAVDVLGMTLIGRWMVEYVNIGTDGLLLFALIAAVVVGLSGRWLYQQQQKIRMEETGMDKAEKDAHHGN